ncbi:MAG: tRNA lysidine(34) synthetase TilS [Bacteroidota bacterium]
MPTSDVHDAFRRLGLGADTPVVVGVSGGVDSVVLLRLLHEAGIPVVVAHVDYGLRPGSAEDAAFVAGLADSLAVPARVHEAEMPDEGNRQAVARDLRYAFFREVAVAHGASVVAVGHTATDQAETVLAHLIRGAGAAGLAGMAESRDLAPGIRLVRPMLGLSREDVERLARTKGWAWREDASNATDSYLRNRMRHKVLPLLEDEGGTGTLKRIAQAAERLRETVEHADSRLDRVGIPREGGGAIPLPALAVLTSSERAEVLASALRRWAPEAPRSARILAQVDGLLEAQVGARVDIGPWVFWREREALVIARREDAWPGAVVRVGSALETPPGVFLARPLSDVPDAFTSDPNREIVDGVCLRGILRLRPWREGDRFQPLGMNGTVLVSDLLTNRRVAPSDRSRQLVLTREGEIVWVVGHRVAEMGRVTQETAQAVSLEWTPRG